MISPEVGCQHSFRKVILVSSNMCNFQYSSDGFNIVCLVFIQEVHFVQSIPVVTQFLNIVLCVSLISLDMSFLCQILSLKALCHLSNIKIKIELFDGENVPLISLIVFVSNDKGKKKNEQETKEKKRIENCINKRI